MGTVGNGIEVEGIIERIEEAVGTLPADILRWAILVLLAIIALYIAYRLLFASRGRPPEESGEAGIDVINLGDSGPPSGGPVLEFYDIPVRLAAVVLAPVGRGSEIPPPGELDDTYEALLPGLARVVETHRPLLRTWPPQLSASGFAHKVFQQCPMPGEGGKDSPWNVVAGVFKFEGRPVMAGLILRTERPTSHGGLVIEDPDGGWIGCLRVNPDTS